MDIFQAKPPTKVKSVRTSKQSKGYRKTFYKGELCLMGCVGWNSHPGKINISTCIESSNGTICNCNPPIIIMCTCICGLRLENGE